MILEAAQEAAISEAGIGLEFHELANVFPAMSDEDYRPFVEDIRRNGQQEDILLYDGKIIDGRNRYRACLELGIEPRVQEWNGGLRS